MNAVRILTVQPSLVAPVGRLNEWLIEAGAELDLVEPAEQGVPGDLDDHEALLVLGGEMRALDDPAHPWLTEVRALLSRAVGRSVPVLAVGLGAQLLAMATGGQVRAARNGPEVGTLLIAKRDVAAEDPLLGPVPLTPDVLLLHSDEVSTLPPSAQLLASSPRCDNQAFRVGDWAYGLQFHVETTTEAVLDWVRRVPELAEAARSGHLEREHLDAFHADLEETWRPVAEEFVRIAATPRDQRRTTRSLPMA